MPNAQVSSPVVLQSVELAPVAISGSATDLTTGTLSNARLSDVPNSALAHSSVTIAGHTVRLGGSQILTASDLTYMNPNSGGVSQSLRSKFSQYIDVRDFGAYCDGSHDDTTAIQNAINAAQSVGATVHLFGNSVISRSLAITESARIIGDGLANTTLTVTSSSVTAILFNPSSPNRYIDLENFNISYPSVVNTEAYGIEVGNSLYNNIASLIRCVGVFNASNGILLINSINPIVDNCVIQYFYGNGIEIENPLLPDSGGAIITDNQIVNNGTSAPASNSIYWVSGGGILISGNKLLTANMGLNIQMTAQTTEFQFINNLVVNMNTAGIIMETTNNHMIEMIVTNNIFDSCNYALYVPLNADGKWLYNLIFNNNTISTAFNSATNQITIYDAQGFIVANNCFLLNGSSSPRGIFTDASSSNGVVGPNVYSIYPPGGGSWTTNDIASSSTTVVAGG